MPHTHGKKLATSIAVATTLLAGTAGPAAIAMADPATPGQPNASRPAQTVTAVTINGTPASRQGDTWTAHVSQTTQPADTTMTATVTYTDGTVRNVTLSKGATVTDSETTDPATGRTTLTTTTTYKGETDGQTIQTTIHASTVKDPANPYQDATVGGVKLTPTAQGATGAIGGTLDGEDNAPATITLSNGDTATLATQTPVTVKTDGTHATHSRTATYTASKYGYTATITMNATRTTPISYTAQVDGKDVPLTLNGDGVYEGSIDLDKPATTATVTPSVGDPVMLMGKPTVQKTQTSLGQVTTQGETIFSNQHVKITARYKTVTGTPVTLGGQNGGASFTQDGDTWKATAATVTLDGKNKPSTTTVTLSDGTTVPVTWDSRISQTTVDGVDYVTRQGTASGVKSVDGVSQKYVVTVTASRAKDTTLNGISLVDTPADSQPVNTVLPGFHPAQGSYTVTLPHGHADDSYTLAVDAGVDADVSDVTASLGPDGSRILSVTVNGKRYTATVGFTPAGIKQDSPAKLQGIYVNKTGQHSQGDLVDKWDPNRLEYTVTVGEHDPSPYILPVAPTGVSVKASDVTQTADGATQSWQVTDTATGATRTYKVTVVRQHSWKTAAEQFTPADPVAQKATEAPASSKDTSLKSAGYTRNGVYKPQSGTDYQIPQGGAFSYEPKAGQSVSVSSRLVKGMTYEYTVSVLAPDGHTFARHRYTVTYITPATHSAQLTGIKVNGKTISGFDPAKLSYDVNVADVNRWTVVPQYDRTLGVTVTTSKDGRTATITVTSADGLVKTVYTVHAHGPASDGGAGADGTGVNVDEEASPVLAETGSDVRGPVAAMLAAFVAGVADILLSRRSRGKHAA